VNGGVPHSRPSQVLQKKKKKKQVFYWVLLGLEKETKMMSLPLCKKNILFAFFAQFMYTRLHFFFL
jgi:hypothetical protein